MCGRLIKIIILCVSLCLIADFAAINGRCAENDDSNVSRNADYYNVQYGTSPFGGTWTMGQYGPDVGIGEQGYQYQYSDPLTGTFVSYSSSGIGAGLGGIWAGYNGMYSNVAQQSYGPYAYGNTPEVQPTVGWSTQGSTSGNLFGYNTNYYQAQPATYGLMGGLLGGLGGYYGGGYGLSGYGLSGYGLGGYGLGGYGLSGYGLSGYGSPSYSSSLLGLGAYSPFI